MRIILLIVALVALATLLLRGQRTPDSTLEAAADHAPRYTISQLQAVRTNAEGQPTLRLSVDKAEYFDDKSALLRGITAQGLSGGASPWTLHSDMGRTPANQQRLMLYAPVTAHGRFPDGQALTLRAGEVWLDQQKQRMSSSQPVSIQGPGRELHAQSWQAGFDGKTLNLKSVEMRYALRSGR